jgi:hypothetical protein
VVKALHCLETGFAGSLQSISDVFFVVGKAIGVKAFSGRGIFEPGRSCLGILQELNRARLTVASRDLQGNWVITTWFGFPSATRPIALLRRFVAIAPAEQGSIKPIQRMVLNQRFNCKAAKQETDLWLTSLNWPADQQWRSQFWS